MPALKTRNLAALRIFTAVARAGSLSAAARTLGVSTALVSGTIKELEAEFETPLLTRTKNRSSCTEAGQALCDRAERILQEIDEMRETARARSGGMSGLLRIHTRVAPGLCFVVPVVRAFREAHPDVFVQLDMSDERVNLSEMNVDMSIVDEVPDVRTPVARRILSSRRIVCGSPEYLRRCGVPREPAELAQHQCITSFVPRAQPAWRFRRAGATQLVAVPSAVQTSDWQAMLRLGLEGNGLLLVAEHYVGEALRSGELVRVLAAYDCAPGQGSDFGVSLWALHHHTRHRSPKVRAFVDLLVAFVEDRIAPGR